MRLITHCRVIPSFRSTLNLTLVVGLLATSITVFAQQAAPVPAAQPRPAANPPESISAADFSKMIREMSEEGGYFLSDNFSSNETSYLLS